MATRTSTADRTVNQKVGLVFGAVYILIGLLGFAFTGDVGFAANDGNLLLGIFEINPLHNIVHLLVGVALLGGAMSGAAASRSANLAVGVVYGLVGLLGWFIDGETSANILALNPADHLLHLASAGLLIAVALRTEPVAARTA